jgi:peptidoglycan DL-endopeptidase CwlO
MPCLRDSRECPGPISEATLHRPSPSRVLTAGAIALAAIAPALDSAEHAAEATQALPETGLSPVRVESAALNPDVAFADRSVVAQRASRAVARRATNVRPAVRRATGLLALRAVRAAERSAAREAAKLQRRALVKERRAAALINRQVQRVQRVQHTRVARSVVTRHATASRGQRVVSLGGGMTAVIAFAKSQVGKRYVSGGEGPGGFDCSGFTKRAYAHAGLRLPHSSGAQAARARSVSRAMARPGDLVVGPGHVGIYMGRGMMIDAGNSRTGVVYRKLYSGLRVARF